MPSETLAAVDVRAELLRGLAPAWSGLLSDLRAKGEVVEPDRLLFVIQLAPPRARVMVEGREPEPARQLVSAPLPDGNPVLQAAIAYMTGVLSAHEAAAADRALAYTLAMSEGRRPGGLFVLVSPARAETRAYLALDGKDLSESLDLGGIVGRATLH